MPTARLVIKDILSGDGAKTELKEVYKVVDMKDQQIVLFKQKDSLKDVKIGNLELINEKKDQQIGLYKDMTNDLQKELKLQKFKTAVYKAGSGMAVIMTFLYLLK